MMDLHAHTTASDGTLSPTELVLLARDVGLTALAVTDHDTVEGVAEAIAAAEKTGLELVPGIEISVDYPHGELHLLGYYVDPQNEAFLSRVTYLQENRANRNQVMVRRMQELGIDVTWDDVLAEAGEGQVGRPHMARALVRKGYATSLPDAFERLVGDGKPLHVPKVRLDPREAIELVHQGGGAAVVAHPKYLGFDTEESLAAEIARLKECGLDGLECYYSQHSEEETERFLRVARELSLVVTGGSDFHGTTKDSVRLGRVYRNRPLDPALLGPIRAAAGR
ncbi:MAG: PHP domain-containing protein [Armatimonadota bacterium]